MSADGRAGSLPSTEIGTHQQGGEGGHLWPDCLGANDVLGVTPLLLKPFDFGCSVV